MDHSITVKSSKALRAAYEAIDEDDWAPIPYWLEAGADVAEISYLPFGRKPGEEVRLIVRRVKPTPGSQLALFATSPTTPSSPTGRAGRSSSRPTTVATPRSSSSSGT